MRRAVSFFLLLVVLVNSTGFTLSKHFCGEVLAHITVGDDTQSCCEGEGMSADCCHDEFEQLALDDSQLDHQSLQVPSLTFSAVDLLTHFLLVGTQVIPTPRWVAPSPPLLSSSLYLRVQSLLL